MHVEMIETNLPWPMQNRYYKFIVFEIFVKGDFWLQYRVPTSTFPMHEAELNATRPTISKIDQSPAWVPPKTGIKIGHAEMMYSLTATTHKRRSQIGNAPATFMYFNETNLKDIMPSSLVGLYLAAIGKKTVSKYVSQKFTQPNKFFLSGGKDGFTEAEREKCRFEWRSDEEALEAHEAEYLLPQWPLHHRRSNRMQRNSTSGLAHTFGLRQAIEEGPLGSPALPQD